MWIPRKLNFISAYVAAHVMVNVKQQRVKYNVYHRLWDSVVLAHRWKNRFIQTWCFVSHSCLNFDIRDSCLLTKILRWNVFHRSKLLHSTRSTYNKWQENHRHDLICKQSISYAKHGLWVKKNTSALCQLSAKHVRYLHIYWSEF